MKPGEGGRFAYLWTTRFLLLFFMLSAMPRFYSLSSLSVALAGVARPVCRGLWLVLLACLPLAGRAAPAPERPSLATALAADGTLRPGLNGSFDARDFTMSTAPDGRPVFRPAGTAGTGDHKWQDGFGLPEGVGTNTRGSSVRAVLQVGTNIYIGGNFLAVGGAVANNIARWDGTAWSPLGTGPASGLDGTVRALALAPNGDLYVGGTFGKAGGVVANSVARWNGTTWSSLGTGTQNGVQVNYTVNAVAVGPNGDVYAGGTFFQAGGARANGLARWTGTAWTTVGGDLGAGSTVYALGFDAAGRLYVGGNISQAGSQSAAGIARWDGTAWNNLGGGSLSGTSTVGQVLALAVAPNGDLYIGGDFTSVSGVPANYVARWNGTAWTALGTGTSNRVTALALSPAGDVYAGGYLMAAAGGVTTSGVAHWNGTAWGSLGAAAASPLFSVACLLRAANGDVYVGGDFGPTTGSFRHAFARWTGTAWTTVGTGQGNGVYGEVRAVAVASNGDVYIGGRFSQVGNLLVNNLARWNGSSWNPVGTAPTDGVGAAAGGTVNALVFAPNGDLYVGGAFATAGSVTANGVARWTGTAWNALADAGGAVGLGASGRAGALALAPNGDLYVGGNFSTAGSLSTAGVARWNGTAWNRVGSGLGNSAVDVLALAPNGDLYAGGQFVQTSSTPASYLVRWNGTAWGGVGSGLSGGVLALAVAPNGDLYAGGLFTRAGTATANGIARWDGTAWSPLGTGSANGVLMPGSFYIGVSALAFAPSGELYVGGTFTQAGGTAASYLTSWNGSAWNGLSFGTGLNNSVLALAPLPGGRLAAGGFFAGLGDTSKPSVCFALFDPNALPTATATSRPALPAPQVYPNPARGAATVRVLPAATVRHGQLLDALGRVVRHFEVPAQATVVPLSLTGLPAGHYTLRVGAAGAGAAQLVVE